MHDSTTLEPTYEVFFEFLREVHVPTLISHDELFTLSYPLGEFVLYPTSYTYIFCNIHPNEVWVKSFFLMVPHEEYETSISTFDDEIMTTPSYLHFQHHPLLHYDDTHLHG